MYLKSSALSFCFPLAAILIFTSSAPASKLFKPPVAYNGGGDARSVVVADVNDDDRPDILVANGAAGALLGNGDGTFQAIVTYNPGGSKARSIAVADVNGDSKPDLLLANECSNTCDQGGSVAVLLGNGDGTFAPAQPYQLPSAALSVAAGDLNGDGKPDMAVTTYNQAGVLINNGNGTFQEAIWYSSGGTDASSIGIGDFNGDGSADLFVGNRSACDGGCGLGGTIGLLLGNGDGTFQSTTALPTNSHVWSAVVADVNVDGKSDLLMVESCAIPESCDVGGVGVLVGNGDGTFQTELDYSSGGFSTTSIAVADVNGDGKPDAVVVNWCTTNACRAKHSLGVLLGNADGTFQPVQGTNSGAHNFVPAIMLADVNNDAKLDAIATGGNVSVLLGTSRVFTTTSLSSSLNPSTFGQSVTLTATVACGDHVLPTGSITFRNGSDVLRTAKLNAAVAKFTTKRLPVGTLSVTASYNGSSTCNKSSSPVLVQVVNALH